MDIRPAALLLPSSGDSELDSDIDAQNKFGYEASSDAESLSSGSSGKYVPPHLRQGHPYLLSKSVAEDSSSRSESSQEGRRKRRPERTGRQPSWMRDKNWLVG